MTESTWSEQSDSPNLLLPKKKKGLQYDIDIDTAIFHELNLCESVSSGQLKTRIEKFLGRSSITPAVYYDHINRMLNKDLEKKDSKERGKQSVFYSLTKEAKREYKLNIHRVNPENILFRKLYERLFFYEFEETPPFIISSEDEFDKLLQSEFNTTSDKFNWACIGVDQSTITNELYPVWGHKKVNGEYHAQKMKEYWKEKRGQSRIFEEVVFTCMPIENNADVWIVKTEYWEINKNGKHKKYYTEYRLELPGVATKEFLNNMFVGTGNFKEEDVEKAVSLLIREGLLERCMVFRDETRYKISDQKLRHMVETLRGFHFDEFNILLCKWDSFVGPTDEEKQRTIWLLGEQESNRIFRLAEMKRYRNKELMKTSKSLDEYYHRYVADNIAPLWATAEHYDAYLKGNVVAKPNSPILHSMLECYKAENRNSATVTQKEVKNEKDILGFHKYMMDRLAYSEQSLRLQAECLKMDNSDVLEEYKFLHHAVRMICPLVFEPANHQLQGEIAYDRLVSDHVTREFAKMIGGIYVGNAYERKPTDSSKIIIYDYKNKKRVPYKTHIVDNRITGKKVKIVDIGKYLE